MCVNCREEPDTPAPSDAALKAMQDAVNRTIERVEMARRTGVMIPPRPCCHTTGPNHHPSCSTKRTEQT